jgi:hypothetical protein
MFFHEMIIEQFVTFIRIIFRLINTISHLSVIPEQILLKNPDTSRAGDFNNST